MPAVRNDRTKRVPAVRKQAGTVPRAHTNVQRTKVRFPPAQSPGRPGPAVLAPEPDTEPVSRRHKQGGQAQDELLVPCPRCVDFNSGCYLCSGRSKQRLIPADVAMKYVLLGKELNSTEALEEHKKWTKRYTSRARGA
jgi:hypothetical protein